MKQYIASENLINIFLKNGFVETTNFKLPEHYKNLKENGYDPHKIKRVLSISKNSYVLFDYVVIKLYTTMAPFGNEMKTEFSKDEIKSIIAFFNLPYQTRNALKKKYLAIPELYLQYYLIKENIDTFKDKQSQLILDAFEQVILD